MASQLIAALAQPENIVRQVACRIRTVSPEITVDFYDDDPSAAFVARRFMGMSLVVGPALAFVTSSTQPIVFQTGA